MLRHRISCLALVLAGSLLFVPGSGAAAPLDVGPSRHIIREAHVQQPLVALTFDDGPDPSYTPQILALLAKHHAHATFFVLGLEAEQHPDLLKQEAQQGHQIGNHGYHHVDLSRLPAPRVQAEIEATATIIHAATAETPSVFRPPLGRFRPALVEQVHNLGYQFVMWTWATNSEDSWLKPSAGTIVKKVLSGVRPGAIILLHDRGGNRRPTVAALDEILERLELQGYRFVTLDVLLRAQSEGSPGR